MNDEQRRIRLQKSWGKQDQLQIQDAVRALMEHRAGRRLLSHLLEITNAFGADELFTGNALTTAFLCGKQDAGKQIMALLAQSAPDKFFDLMKESALERDERERALNGVGAEDGTIDGAAEDFGDRGG